MDEKLNELCGKIASGDVDDEDLLALTEAIGEAIEKGHVPIRCGVPVAEALSKREKESY
jgi:hypothetical protein